MRTRDSRLAKIMRPREKPCVPIRVILRFRELWPNQSFVCNFLCTPRCKSQVPAKETKCLSCFGKNFWNVLTPIHIIRDSYTKIFCRLNVFQGLVVKGIVKEYVFAMLMPSRSHGVTFGHIELSIHFNLKHFQFTLSDWRSIKKARKKQT